MTGLTFVAFSACAQAPELDESVFHIGDRPPADAASPAEAGVGLDAAIVGIPGTVGGGALPGVDAGGQIPGPGGAASGGIGGGIDSGNAGGDAAPGVSPVSDARVGPASDAGTGGSDAAQPVPEAGGGTTGGGTTGGGTPGGSPAGGGTTGGGGTCNPATCTNQCLLLERCCDENDQCACLTPLSRQCTLPSL